MSESINEINGIDTFTEWPMIYTVSRSNWKLAVLVFIVLLFKVWRGRRTEQLGKNPLSKDKNQQQTQRTHDTVRGIHPNPGHIGGIEVFSPRLFCTFPAP